MPRKYSQHPFAIIEQPSARPPTWLRSSVLVVVVGLLAWGGSFAVRFWWLHHLAVDLSQLSDAELRDRLNAIVELGEPGVDALIAQFVHGSPTVATAAFQTLSETQAQWSAQSPGRSDVWQYRLIAGLEKGRADISHERHKWAQRLCEQVLLDTLPSRTVKGRTAYATAVRLIASLQPPNDFRKDNVTSLADASKIGNSLSPPPLSPPEMIASLKASSVVAPLIVRTEPANSPPPNEFVAPPSATRLLPNATKISDVGDTAILQFTSPNPVQEKITAAPTPIQSLAPYETRELIELLVGATAALIAASEDELKARGFNVDDIRMARILVAADANGRIQLIEQLAKQQQVDPRPFLLWLSKEIGRAHV